MFDIGDLTQRHSYDKKVHLLNLYLHDIEKNTDYVVLPIEPIDEYKYRGDFLGLLKSMEIDEQLHLPVMVLNNIKSSDGYYLPITHLKYPNRVTFNKLFDFMSRIPKNVL